MKIVPDVEERIKRAIRDACALDPLINNTGIQEVLKQQFGREFSFFYIKRLRGKILMQGLTEADRTQIQRRLFESRENYRIARERLLKVLYWTPETGIRGIKPPLQIDIIEAAKALVMLDIAFAKMEIENGMYKKPLEARAKELYTQPLDPEVRAVIVASWHRFGMLPAATVEEMVPAAVESVPEKIV